MSKSEVISKGEIWIIGIMLGILLLVGVGFFAIPAFNNDTPQNYLVEGYQYEITVSPDVYWARAIYLAQDYQDTGDFITLDGYYHSAIDVAWPTARNFKHYNQEIKIPKSSIKGISEITNE